MNFGQAITHLKQGHMVARSGWNGKGMYLYLNEGSMPINVKEDIEAKDCLKDGVAVELFEGRGADAQIRMPSINMRAATGSIVTGWLASQTDMLAEDWDVTNLITPEEVEAEASVTIAEPTNDASSIIGASKSEGVNESELIEAAARNGGLRVTELHVEEFIVEEHFFTAQEGVFGRQTLEGHRTTINKRFKLLTFCVMLLKNGFTVHGISACADPKNYDRAIGERLARANAKNKVWELLRFELRTKLNLIERAGPPSLGSMETFVGTKVVHASPMTKAEYCSLRGWLVPGNEDPNEEGYLVEYEPNGNIPNVPGFFGYVSWSPKRVFDKSYQS